MRNEFQKSEFKEGLNQRAGICFLRSYWLRLKTFSFQVFTEKNRADDLLRLSDYLKKDLGITENGELLDKMPEAGRK